MNINSKHVAALLAASALSFGLPASAQPGPGMGPGGGPGAGGCPMYGGQMKGKPGAWADQHLAQFKSQLKITSEQEPLWQAFADKVKASTGQRAAHWQQMQQAKTAPERMNLMLEHMKQHTAAMEGVNDSFKRLYDALTPEQKAVADKFQPFGGPMGGKRGGMRGRGPGGGGPGMQGPGPGPNAPAR
ncbi:MAG TPA: Spy/CpxP family protein refolding chaperone [Rhodocyclaceae bacterium]